MTASKVNQDATYIEGKAMDIVCAYVVLARGSRAQHGHSAEDMNISDSLLF